MTYPAAIDYLNSFVDFEKVSHYSYDSSLKLERVKEFLQALNNPQNDLDCIHVAGTKGKGSVCAFIAYILREAGFKIGLYTSPHLEDFRERIRILNPRPKPGISLSEFEGMIKEQDLAQLVEKLKPEIEAYNSGTKYGKLSFFEVYTALAFTYFKENQVDFVILETGLGGRLDATNTVNSLIAVITPISYEHIEYLGNSLAEIALEKAGIIKNQKLTVISAPQQRHAKEVIRLKCKQQSATLCEVGKDITYHLSEAKPRAKQRFNIDGVFGRLEDLSIGFLGKHQVDNAVVAVGAVLALGRSCLKAIGVETINKGLASTLWPGRFEIIQRNKRLFILDGAQNGASAKALKETIVQNFSNRRVIIIFGISADKDITGVCEVLVKVADEIILTQADNPRAAPVDVIEEIVKSCNRKLGAQITKTNTVEKAIELACSSTDSEVVVLITGSLYLVGEARKIIRN